MKKKIYKSLEAKKLRGLIKIFCNRDYLSWWIANFGVVPWLLFAAFLFLPALVFLRALLFFVTRVFETISLLLQRTQLCELRRIKYLPRMGTSVKALSLGLFLIPQLALSEEPKVLKNQSVILSIGEVKELSFPSIDRFTIGNNDSVSHKFFRTKKSLLLKGKKLGISQLLVWRSNGEKLNYQIYVLSKSNQLKLLSLTESLISIGLQVENKGPWLRVNGKLDNINNYNQFLSLKKNNDEKIQSDVLLSKKLKKNLLAEVIKSLFEDHISDFRCEVKTIELICHLSDTRSPSKQLEQFLIQKYGVRFIRHSGANRSKNYRLKVKIIQIDSSQAEAHGFGLHQLSGSLKGIFEEGWQTLYEKNKVQLHDLGVDASLLAEPVILIRPDRKVKIQVGADIPYPSTNDEGVQNTLFKFAGLKLNFELKNEGDGFLLSYSAEITKPGRNGEIGGSKESASARISPQNPIELFEINFTSDALNKESVPIFGRFPILGSLFSNKNKNKNFKKITGIVYLEES